MAMWTYRGLTGSYHYNKGHRSIYSFMLNLGSRLCGLYRKQGVGNFNHAWFKGSQKHKGQANPLGKA